MDISVDKKDVDIASTIRDTSTFIVSTRGTSTPIKNNTLNTLHLEPNCSGFEETIQEKLQHFFTKVDNTPHPIFGTINLLCWVKQNHQSVDEKFISCSSNFDESLRNKNRKLNPSNIKGSKKNAVTKKSSRISSMYCKQSIRKSDHDNNQKPKVKVIQKRPRSPKLLTAMRAKLRQNRERLKKDKEKSKNSDSETIKKVRLENVLTVGKSAIIPIALRETKTKRTKQNEPKKLNSMNTNKNNHKVEPVPFKAHPIRKYAPLPVIKRRNITIPQSPKLGKQRLHAVKSY